MGTSSTQESSIGLSGRDHKSPAQACRLRLRLVYWKSHKLNSHGILPSSGALRRSLRELQLEKVKHELEPHITLVEELTNLVDIASTYVDLLTQNSENARTRVQVALS